MNKKEMGDWVIPIQTFVLNESFYTLLKHLSYHGESRAGDQTRRLRSKIVDSSELWQSNF